VGASAQALLQERRPSIEAVLTSVLNDVQAMSGDVVLVLDDYHLIDAPAVHDGMAFLVEHLPPQLHLVIAGRADPVLPLARLRGRGELVEIRAADLRFTPEEAAAYLNGAMGLPLTAHDIQTLEGRTEGWIAALQLAALSMRGRADVAGFIAGFAGDDRYIIDYLVEEVLGLQPEAVRAFLLQTSILSRMCGPLCDAVTGQNGGKTELATLERANLFLVPLDDRRRWYRYHHLFAEVLQAHLHDEQPAEVPALHRRASAWFSDNGEPAEAIRHALAADDLDRAADLIELAIPTTTRARQEATLRSWLEALPEEVIRVRPVLSNGYAGSLLVRGEVEGVDARLRDAEGWVAAAGDGPPPAAGAMVVADEHGFRRLPGAVAVHRAGLARMLGDLPGTIAHAERALDLLAEDDLVGHGAAAALLGLAHWSTGDLASAHRRYSEGMASLEKAGYLPDVVGGAIALADLRIAQGQLRAATATYERGLQLATGQGPTTLRGAADMHVGISELLRERNDLDGARRHLAMARELGDPAGMPQFPYRWRLAMARIREAEGDRTGALELLDEAERRYVSDFFPDVRPISAIRARVWVAQGRLSEAIGWAHERGLSVEDELSYLREFEHLTLVQICLAHPSAGPAGWSVGDAAGLLERLLRAAEQGDRAGSVIEILLLEALALKKQGDVAAALVSLHRALTLAEPEGYLRLVADAGPSMEALLDEIARQGVSAAYVSRLRAVHGGAEDSTALDQGLTEPLSDRELDVLRLLATDLSGPDIARELVVSLHTVRTHTQHIYAKFGVNNRRAAVRRALELGLTSRTRRR
jgi:LuxR family maltose regulon positive regulatory protein